MSLPNRKLKFFRMIDGQKLPCTMELTNDWVVLGEVVGKPVTPGAARKSETMTPERKKSMAVSRWAAESVVDNPIEGSDALRAEFFDTLHAMQDEHRREETKCPPCQIGKLIRRYRRKLEDAGML